MGSSVRVTNGMWKSWPSRKNLVVAKRPNEKGLTTAVDLVGCGSQKAAEDEQDVVPAVSRRVDRRYSKVKEALFEEHLPNIGNVSTPHPCLNPTEQELTLRTRCCTQVYYSHTIADCDL